MPGTGLGNRAEPPPEINAMIRSSSVAGFSSAITRSAAAARLLTQQGKQVVDLGGMASWPNADDIVR